MTEIQTLDDHIDNIELELNKLMMQGNISSKTWFDDDDEPLIQYPSTLFMLRSAEINDLQVVQNSNQIARDIEYDVYCLYSSIEGLKKFRHSRKFVDAIYYQLQSQHASGKMLNCACFDLMCPTIEYGIVTLERLKTTTVSGGVIKLIIQVFEQFETRGNIR
jgi:hypothetical protein